MMATIRPKEEGLLEASVNRPFTGTAKRIFFSIMERLKTGRIRISDGGFHRTFGSLSDDADLEASVTVLHPAFYNRIVFGGSTGAGEAYMAGLWRTDDLTRLIRIVLKNQAVFENMDS